MIDVKALNQIIEERGIKKKKLASMLGIHPNALTRKLKGEVDFKASEIVILRDILRLSDADVKRIFLLSWVNNIHTGDKANDRAD